ncbi:MAG: ATP-binding cassette domain-containing protein [Streptosporangiales bacterium]|nr:ATP-binding cassette domain-containing protein [Streptosporangiales bacterium]
MPPPAMVVENYSFWYKLSEGREALALHDVSFEVSKGDFVLVLGMSGSGKSTLALNLVGVYPDYFGGRNEGRILVDHAEKGLVNRRELDRGQRFHTVNMLFQNPEEQIVTLTVEEEIAFALENYLVPRGEIGEHIDAALDLVGLNGFRRRPTHQLSGGEKQRAALAAMLAMRPRVLILDEPTSNLDPVGTEEVLDAVGRIRERSDVTLMVVEHEVDAVFDQVDKVLLVDGKTVHGPNTPREFLAGHGLDVRDRMGLWIPQASEVALELGRAGVSLPTVPLNGEELVAAVRDTIDSDQVPIAAPVPPPAPPTEPPSVEPGEVVIEVRDASFSYPSRPDVLRGVNLAVRRGELLAIVGQNGSGKSTLAAHFNGILKPSAGEVLVHGKPTTKYKLADLVRRVAYIFQVPEKQFIRNTVYEEMAHGLRALRLANDEVRERVDRFLESVRLLDRKEASPYVLSHGQKRRLSVACMVIAGPDVVVLDEPTFGQDYQQAQRLMRLLRALADDGAAVAFITHDMRLVAEYADRCAAMADGKVIFDGSVPDLFAGSDVLARARLTPPAVHGFSAELLGEPCLDTAEVRERIKEAIHGRSRTLL